MAKPHRSKTPVALKNSTRTPYANWQLDADYLRKLSPSELAWLAQFTAEFYRSAPKATLQTQDQLRDRWKAFKANARCVMSRGDGLRRRASNEDKSLQGLGDSLGQHWDKLPARHDELEDEVIARLDAERTTAERRDDD